MNVVASRSIKLLASCLLLASALVYAAGPKPTPGAGLYGTAHDFTGNGWHNTMSTNVGLCSICHTPHSAISTSLLWNQKLTTATFTWGDATQTSGGTTLPSSAHLGPSTKCLSCHDGTVAVGDVALFNQLSGAIPAGTYVLRLGASGFGVGHNGDMSGVHPIAVPYPYNNAVSTYNTITTGAAVNLSEFVANPHAPTANSVKLYSDDGTGKISTGPTSSKTGIECTSCHDPHNKQVQDDVFLRGKLAGSTKADGYLCLQCHIK